MICIGYERSLDYEGALGPEAFIQPPSLGKKLTAAHEFIICIQGVPEGLTEGMLAPIPASIRFINGIRIRFECRLFKEMVCGDILLKDSE